jgi:hypothetical protein
VGLSGAPAGDLARPRKTRLRVDLLCLRQRRPGLGYALATDSPGTVVEAPLVPAHGPAPTPRGPDLTAAARRRHPPLSGPRHRRFGRFDQSQLRTHVCSIAEGCDSYSAGLSGPGVSGGACEPLLAGFGDPRPKFSLVREVGPALSFGAYGGGDAPGAHAGVRVSTDLDRSPATFDVPGSQLIARRDVPASIKRGARRVFGHLRPRVHRLRRQGVRRRALPRRLRVKLG